MEMLALEIRHTMGELVTYVINVDLGKMLVSIWELRCCSCMWSSSVGVNMPICGI